MWARRYSYNYGTFSETNQLWYVLSVLDVPVKLNCFHTNDRLPLHGTTALDNMHRCKHTMVTNVILFSVGGQYLSNNYSWRMRTSKLTSYDNFLRDIKQNLKLSEGLMTAGGMTSYIYSLKIFFFLIFEANRTQVERKRWLECRWTNQLLQ